MASGIVPAGDIPSLGEIPPTDEELLGLAPNPDSDPPDGRDAWMAGVPAEVLYDPLERQQASQAPEALPGLLPRHLGTGAGFDAGGVADRLPPGVTLAGLTADACTTGLSGLSDDELAGVMLAWRRLSSWAAAGELAAAAELDRRRHAQVAAGADPHLAEHAGDELAMVLTLTPRSAGKLLDFACGLRRLPRTREALAAGDIDRSKALIMVDEVAGLDGPHAAAVEAAVIGPARGQTTGQLRAAVRRAVLAADPDAAARRRAQAEKDARVEVWDEGPGTASLAGRDLPAADVLAADQRISALAHHLKAGGHEGTLDQLRAKAYTALLLDRPIGEPAGGSHATAAAGDTGGTRATTAKPPVARGGQATGGTAASTGKSAAPGDTALGAARDAAAEAAAGGAGAAPASSAGLVNLTMPLATWLGEAAPGEVAGFGPIPAGDARALARLAAGQPGSRWCITLTGRDGRAVAHGCARAGPAPPRGTSSRTGQRNPSPGRDRPGWALTVTITPLAAGDCSHARESAGYQPSPALRHAVTIRQRRCSFPGCRRPAGRCDLDHTIPYEGGGRTCECNCAPLCRRHHEAKQAGGWRLDQPEPGIMIWRPPHGRTYRVEPEPYFG